MKAADIHIALIENYYTLLKNLSPDSKLELISRLSKSMKTVKKQSSGSLRSLYGALVSETSADEMIENIKKARTFDRNRPEL